MSLIAWLDVSAEEQRRVRELVAMFADKSTLDELGVGQIRDAFSDTLFPGLSTVQTRARYFLFVPWAYRLATERAPRSKVAARAESYERQTVVALRNAQAGQGIVGAVAGAQVKNLPSGLYWVGLTEFGILTRPLAREQLGEVRSGSADTDELAERSISEWSPTMPRWPDGFPNDLASGFELSPDEAGWLRERIMTAVPNAFLADLVRVHVRPEPTSHAPWDDPAIAFASSGNRDVIEDARLFSLVMFGGSLLYNLLVAERYEAGGYNRVEEPAVTARTALTDWVEQVAASQRALATWDRVAMWERTYRRSPNVSASTRTFVEHWISAIAGGAAPGSADSRVLREMVRRREFQTKGSRSRLSNDRMLENWLGSEGSRPQNYRWPNARLLLTDVADGIDRART